MINVRCAVCGKDEAKKVLESHDKWLGVDLVPFTLVRCTLCGLMYLNPQPTPEELVKYYPPHYAPYLNDQKIFGENALYTFMRRIKHSLFGVRSTKKVSATSMKISTDTKKRVLDFGCGSGRFLIQLRKNHPLWELHGFDIAANRKVQEIGDRVSLINGTLEDLVNAFSQNFFDIIYMNNVLEHLNDPAGALQTLASLLADDGQIVIDVPNIDSLKFKVFRKNFAGLDIPRHLYDFSRVTLEVLCAKCGLSVESVAFSGSPKSTTRSLYYLFGITRATLDPILYSLIELFTRLVGPARIDNDQMQFIVRKAIVSGRM